MNDRNTAEIYYYIITQQEISKIPDGEFYNEVIKKAAMVASKLGLEKKKVVDFSWENSYGDVNLIFFYERTF